MSYTGKCDGYHAKGYKSQDNPGRWNGYSAADDKRPTTVVAVKDLSECFNKRLMFLTRDSLVFDILVYSLCLTLTEIILSRVPPGIKEGKEECQSNIRSEMTQS